MTRELFCEKFESGISYETFQARATDQREQLEALYDYFEISDAKADAFGKLARAHGGRINVIVLAEAWCGDAVRALPLLAKLCQRATGMTLRILHSDLAENQALLRRWPLGERNPIPVVVFFDKDFGEIGHWIERCATANDFRARLLEAHPGLKPREFFRLAGPKAFEAFRQTHWKDTLAEWALILKAPNEASQT